MKYLAFILTLMALAAASAQTIPQSVNNVYQNSAPSSLIKSGSNATIIAGNTAMSMNLTQALLWNSGTDVFSAYFGGPVFGGVGFVSSGSLFRGSMFYSNAAPGFATGMWITTTGTLRIGTGDPGTIIITGSTAATATPLAVTGNLSYSGTLLISGTAAAPSNTSTPAVWFNGVISGTTFKIPLYQ